MYVSHIIDAYMCVSSDLQTVAKSMRYPSGVDILVCEGVCTHVIVCLLCAEVDSWMCAIEQDTDGTHASTTAYRENDSVSVVCVRACVHVRVRA